MTHLTNTEILCFVLGWQGGTIHQVSRTLSVPSDDILNADAERMRGLCRMAQLAKQQERNRI